MLSKSVKSSDMTNGSLFKGILYFSIPLCLSQLLQVLFNLADIAVVGKFSSAAALGSVGDTAILVALFTGILTGIGSGVNIRTAYFIGAKKDKDVSETVHTSFVLCLATGLFLFFICFFLCRPLLELLQTKAEHIDGAELYLKIYAAGLPALGIFNFGNAVLSSKGDTKRPLIYLAVAGVLNVILNLVFVIVFKMAADGVSLASVISIHVSAILVLIRLFRCNDACKLVFKKIRLYKDKALSVLALGAPASLQNSIFAVANLFIQSAVNSFTFVEVEGNAAAANADTIIYNVMAAIYTACSTFMGQNLGAGKKDRVIKSYYICLLYSFGIGVVLGGLLLVFGKEFLYVFTNEQAVVNAGYERLKIMGFSYCVSAFMDCTIAASRGIGKSAVPTAIVILGSCVFRVVWIYTVFAKFHTIPSLYLLYIFSWSITAIAEIIYFFIEYKKIKKDKSTSVLQSESAENP